LTRRSKIPQTSQRSQASQKASVRPVVIALVVDVGASVALHDILLELPEEFQIPLVVLQHTETLLQEAQLNALQRTVPFRVEMVTDRHELQPGSVYVGFAEQSYRLEEQADSLNIVVEPEKSLEWPAGSSLRQFGATLGARLLVALLATRAGGSDLKQLGADLVASGVGLAILRSEAPNNAGSAFPALSSQVELVEDMAELAELFCRKSQFSANNQLAQSFRQ